jgi:hypothetical protein
VEEFSIQLFIFIKHDGGTLFNKRSGGTFLNTRAGCSGTRLMAAGLFTKKALLTKRQDTASFQKKGGWRFKKVPVALLKKSLGASGT